MKAFHQSRLSRYRHPYGALPALSSVNLAISLTPEPHEIGEVTGVFLCYAYGLHHLQESRQRMVVRESPDDKPGSGKHQSQNYTLVINKLDEPQDYEIALTLPAEPGLFFLLVRDPDRQQPVLLQL